MSRGIGGKAAALAVLLALVGCGVDGAPRHPRATPADVYGGGPSNVSVSVPPGQAQTGR